MKTEAFSHIYLIGIGGIGMSALARYFHKDGKVVAGYDRAPSSITDALIDAGIYISFFDELNDVPRDFMELPKEDILIIYTPAVPMTHPVLQYFFLQGYRVHKRAEVLGWLTREKFTVAIAGTHGKTSTTTMVTHLLQNSGTGCTAFMGGLSVNYNTNFLADPNSENMVVEADEYDRSFLQLYPDIAVVTSMDADHLDIYGTHEDVLKSYQDFISHVTQGGVAVLKKGLSSGRRTDKSIYRYAIGEKADFWSDNIRVSDGRFVFDFHAGEETISNISFGIPGRHNVENATAAASVAHLMKIPAQSIKSGLESFKGVHRRFEFHIRNNNLVYVDDYAHHPTELNACISGLRELYPEARITGIFQPHLYSRTRDFAADFARSLDLLDECILLEIYAARELPIEGVSSSLLANNMHKKALIMSRNEVLEYLNENPPEVLVTMGAGDIDKLIEPIKKVLQR